MDLHRRDRCGQTNLGRIVLFTLGFFGFVVALTAAGCQGPPQEQSAPALETEEVEAAAGSEEDKPDAVVPPGATEIGLEGARAALDNESVLFLDARTAEQYAEGHVPGALSLFVDDFEELYPDLADEIEAASRVITYCDGIKCGKAPELAERLLEVTERPIYVFRLGWPEWKAADYPQKEGPHP